MVAYVCATKCERAAACRSAFAAASGSAASAPSPSFSFLVSSRPPISSSSWPSASSASGRGPSGASSGLSETGAGVAAEGSRDDSFTVSSSMLVSAGGVTTACGGDRDESAVHYCGRHVPCSSALADVVPSRAASCAVASDMAAMEEVAVAVWSGVGRRCSAGSRKQSRRVQQSRAASTRGLRCLAVWGGCK
jgi:hypothetical protein